MDAIINFLKNLGLSQADAAKYLTEGIAFGGKLLAVIFIFFIALIIAGWARSLVEKALKRIKFDNTLTKFFANTSRYVVILFAVLGCLGYFGFNITSFAGVLGGATLAIGLAFQGSLSNVAAGVMLLAFRPFKVGEVVTIAGKTGAVDEIGLFVTSLDTPDRQRIIIPNGKIFGDTIVNITHSPTRRVDVNVGVDYDADIDEVRQVLVTAAKSVKTRVSNEEPVAMLIGLGGSSVDWQVRIFCNTEDYWTCMEEGIRAVKNGLDAAHIGIPYPKMVIHQAGK